jgi:predicted dehydrogenase
MSVQLPSRIGVGIVGLHFGATVHLPAFRTDPRCTVVALAGRDSGRAASTASECGVPDSYGDWRALVASPAVTAVSIAVPPAEQPAIAVEAARLGKHVFCEKPLAATLAAAETVVDAVRTARVIHAIDFIFPELPAWELTRKLLREGLIGAPRHFSYVWRLETYASRIKARSWKTGTGEGGGVLGNFLSHVIFNIEWLFGDMVGMTKASRISPGEADEFCECVAHVANGVHGAIAISTNAYLGGGHEVRIFGDAGTLMLRNATPDHADGFEVSVATRDRGDFAIIQSATGAGSDGRIAPVARIVRRFIDEIQKQGTVTPNLEDGLRVQRWLDHLSNVDAR